MDFKTIEDYRQEVKRTAVDWLIDHYDELETHDFWQVAPMISEYIYTHGPTFEEACENVKFIVWDKSSMEYVFAWLGKKLTKLDSPCRLDASIRQACFNEKIRDIETAFYTLEYNHEFGIDDDSLI